MLKGIVHFVIFILLFFGVHQWILLPSLGVSSSVPVIYQHLLLGGFSVLVYAVTHFIAKHFFGIVGFVVMGFLMLKMVLVGVFVNVYSQEISVEPIIKYLLLAFYFVYLIFLLFKIVPLINVNPLELKENKS